ncbi:MAG: D-tyrosyl-tRNA(Tyr) deacylase [Saccharospirillaceae bacterium]|nr:D-aminoacyl-tRNA deacylase [Pseudomonadales bacterium]NRB81033.1 D-tyrosyl-tRNA(Tyr) deacylase [Saccharospirillaceae bacterium]
MNILIQRVKHASVQVDNQNIAKIQQGLLVFVGLEKDDTAALLKKVTNKLLNYRIFSDDNDKMNLNVQQIQGELLVVSQFTLAAQTSKGLRPGFSSALHPEQSEPLFKQLVETIKATYPKVQTGQFGADMQIELLNDGPVTFMLNFK